MNDRENSRAKTPEMLRHEDFSKFRFSGSYGNCWSAGGFISGLHVVWQMFVPTFLWNIGTHNYSYGNR